MLLIPLGFADFGVKTDDVIFDYGDEPEEATGLNYVTFDYSDGDMTADYRYYFRHTNEISEDRVPLPNIDNSAHQFQGWFLDKQGTTELDFSSHTFVAGERFYAKYMDTIHSAFTGSSETNIYASSTYSNPCYLSQYNSLDPLTITKKYDIRYSDSGTYNSSNAGSGAVYRFVNNAKMRMILDSNIIIGNGGTLQLSSVLGVASGSGFNGHIASDDFTALDLNGYTITVKSGGAFNAYGVVYNTKDYGGIVVESGGSMTTIFCVTDFKGGNNLVSSYHLAAMSIGGYCCPYLFCETLLYTGAKVYGETSLCASSNKYTTTAPLIGNTNEFLIQMNAGYLIRRSSSYSYFLDRSCDYGNITDINALYTSAYREHFVFTNSAQSDLEQISLQAADTNSGSFALNSLSLTITVGVSATVNMKYGDFPIPHYFDIDIHHSSLSISMSMVVDPSASIEVDSASTIIFKNDGDTIFARLSVLDEYPIDYYYLKGTARTLGSYYIHARAANSTTPGKVVMNGVFSFDSGTDSSTVYKHYSIGGNITLSSQALESLKNAASQVWLRTYFFYPCLMAAGTYNNYCAAGRYYFAPVISGTNAYFQIGDSTEIMEGTVADFANGLVEYQGQQYFYYYTSRTNTTDALSYDKFDLVLDASLREPPVAATEVKKYNNVVGAFVPIVDSGYCVDNATYGQHGFYITYSGNTYCYVNGAYIKASPATGVNTISNFAVSDGEKFTINSSDVGASCLNGLTYNYQTERWLWQKV